MKHSIVAILILSALTSAFPGPAHAAWSPGDGAAGQAVFRIRGAFVPDNLAGTPAPGWMAGGGVGFGIQRVLVLAVNFDHYELDDRYLRSVEPWTVQLEVGKPFQRRIKPWFGVGTGVYRRIERPWFNIARPANVLGPVPFGDPGQYVKREALLGFNYGFGIWIPLRNRVMADLGLRYHKTLDRDLDGTRSHSLTLSAVGVGVTYGLR